MFEEDESYFPCLIEYQDTKEQIIAQEPQDIENMRSFKVLATRYKEQTK